MSRPAFWRAAALAAGSFACLLSGCHSAYVEVTIDNRGQSPVHLIEVDYPSASFGVGTLAPQSQFHYRFKIQGSGAVKIEFTDAAGKVHDSDGPQLNQCQEGNLSIAIQPTGDVTWRPQLTALK